ncbi:unnamed protein product [Rhodiola kirilowii]
MDGRPQSPPPTVILGKYQLDRLLGKGSFAKVYRAHSVADGTPVAIKIIDKPKPTVADLITREVSAMQRLKHHPNILKIHEVMATKTKIYLVMELAEGGELHSKIARRGRLTEAAARKYFQQLVSALRFCHRHGVAHRDMKPQNLLLDKDGNLKIADFGLSALPEQLSEGVLKTACGTPAYTAPEVFCRPRGGFAGYDGAKADSWSCGVILFVLLSGSLPFDDSNFSAMYKKMYQRDYNLPTWISRPAKSIISQMLDPNPKTRLSIEDLTRFSWFKKSNHLHPELSLFKSDAAAKFEKPRLISMNAFDIISMSSGLDLSGLFESVGTKAKRFTTSFKAESIEERVSEIGVKLGFVVEKGKNGTIGLGKGRVVVMVEVSEVVTESLFVVEVKAVDGGDDFERNHWQGLKVELEDLVPSWHNDTV